MDFWVEARAKTPKEGDFATNPPKFWDCNENPSCRNPDLEDLNRGNLIDPPETPNDCHGVQDLAISEIFCKGEAKAAANGNEEAIAELGNFCSQ
ncbi:hypothetical protein LINGRAHAP2_LOCUS20327 [Linum grandiflorum]